MLVVPAIPYQIYFVYKQRSATLTCDLRLLTVSVPLVRSVMQTNQKTPSLIPMQHHGLQLLTFRRRLHKGSLIETWWGKEKKLLTGREPLFFSLSSPGFRPKGIQDIWSNGNSCSESGTAAATPLRLPVSEDTTALKRASQRRCRPGEKRWLWQFT